MGPKALWALCSAWLVLAIASFSMLAFGDPGLEPVTGAPTISDWFSLYHSLGELKGMTTLGIVVVLIQGLLLLLRSGFDPLPNPIKLLAITGLTMVGGVVGLKLSTNVDWQTALIHSTNLAALQVFGNQLLKAFTKPQLVTPAAAVSSLAAAAAVAGPPTALAQEAKQGASPKL